jgi:YggT family protein
MDVIFVPLLIIINTLISLYIWAIIIYVALSWLSNFDIVNPQNKAVKGINHFLSTIIEPLLVPIQRALPNTGGLDFSPLILILALYFIQMVLDRLVLKVTL